MALVPCVEFTDLDNQPHAIYRTEVHEVRKRSVRVALPQGVISDWIASSHVHRELAISIFIIGDFETELSLLDPLAKSVLHYCRLLLPDDRVLLRKVRSLAEFGKWCSREANAYTHVILIGHGSHNGILFGMDGIASPQLIHAQIEPHFNSAKYFISLCCETGYADFGRHFSNFRGVCRGLAAPFHSVHSAIASQFCQTLLADHLLNGYSFGVAFDHARDAVPGSDSFRLWQAGRMST